jgi:hypothetical protein
MFSHFPPSSIDHVHFRICRSYIDVFSLLIRKTSSCYLWTIQPVSGWSHASDIWSILLLLLFLWCTIKKWSWTLTVVVPLTDCNFSETCPNCPMRQKHSSCSTKIDMTPANWPHNHAVVTLCGRYDYGRVHKDRSPADRQTRRLPPPRLPF